MEGGPRYNILLEAESGLVNYSLSETSLDFGFQQFNQTAEKHLTLLNSGKIPVSFYVGFPCPRQSPFLKVLPLHGILDPGQKQLFTVFICPLVPEKYKTQITIQVSNKNIYPLPSQQKKIKIPISFIKTSKKRNNCHTCRHKVNTHMFFLFCETVVFILSGRCLRNRVRKCGKTHENHADQSWVAHDYHTCPFAYLGLCNSSTVNIVVHDKVVP